MWQRAANDQERRLDHHPLDVLEALDGEVLQRRHVLEPGVVHHDVHVHVELVHRRRVGQVHPLGPATGLGGHRLRRLQVAVHHEHLGAGRAQP
ncbi:hypothetical protein GCM10027614_76500 [Micromonospora vulcania]